MGLYICYAYSILIANKRGNKKMDEKQFKKIQKILKKENIDFKIEKIYNTGCYIDKDNKTYDDEYLEIKLLFINKKEVR